MSFKSSASWLLITVRACSVVCSSVKPIMSLRLVSLRSSTVESFGSLGSTAVADKKLSLEKSKDKARIIAMAIFLYIYSPIESL